MKHNQKQFFLPQEGKSLSEYCILFSFAFLGIIGSTYMLKNCQQSSTHRIISSQSHTLLADQSLVDKSKNKVLEISGDFTQNSPIGFAVSDEKVNQQFLIDFGNGEKKLMSDPKIFYSYNTPGNYKIQLVALQKDQMKLVESRNVLISQKNMYN